MPYCLSDSDGLHVRSILSFLGKDVIFPVLAWSDMTKENKVIPIQLDDGKVVEAVFYGSGTLCLSTQVGCVVGCPFCASGAKGFFRHLTFDEMMTQIEVATNLCTPERITLSGIGEPLHNWDVTKQLIEGDIRGVILSFDQVLYKGFDGHQFIVGLASHFRDLWMCKHPDTISLIEVGSHTQKKYLAQSEITDLSFLEKAKSTARS